MRIIALIRRHPLVTYFALAFTLSWGGILLVVGPGNIPGTKEQFERLFPAVYVAMLVGPSVAGLLMTALVSGRTGLKELVARLGRWRVSPRWYAAALFTAPIVLLVVLSAMARWSSDYRPALWSASDQRSLLAFGIAVGLGAGFFEELGWTGFAIPALLNRRGLLVTGLGVGILWGAWHFLAVLWGNANAYGGVPPALWFLADLFTVLPVYRILMVWVYQRTGSLLVAMLMHASLTSSLLIVGPQGAAGVPLLVYQAVFAGALLVLVAAIFAARRPIRTPSPAPAGR